MSERRFDNRWFHDQRHRLLAPGSTRCSRGFRAVRALGVGAAVRRTTRDGRVADTERMLGYLARSQEASTRAHMQMFRACLEHTVLVPSDELVNAAVQVEWLWHTTPFKKFYRDHLAHVMKVATLALDLCRHGAPFAAPLIDQIGAGLAAGTLGSAALRQAARRAGNSEAVLRDPAFWREAVTESIRLAGLLHDLAYPSIMAAKYVSPAAAVTDPLGSGLDARSAHQLSGAFEDRLLASQFHGGEFPHRGLSNEARDAFAVLLTTSHAVQAGVRILQFGAAADRMWRLTPFELFVIEWAALAAAMHDHDKAFERHQALHGIAPRSSESALDRWLRAPDNVAGLQPCFRRDPVSYLVAFTDQLQDFGRLHLDHGERQAASTTIAVRVPVDAVSLRVDGADATITVFANSSADRARLEASKRDVARLVFDDGGWLDHTGLFNSVSLVVAPAP